MIRSGIMVQWDDTQEYISLNFDDLGSLSRVLTTREIWPGGKIVCYRTPTRVERLPGDAFRLTFIYKKNEQDPAILREGMTWGELIVELNPSKKRGTATWCWGHSGRDPSIPWRRIQRPLVDKRERHHVSRVKRDEGFRNFLLSYERSCAITGEATLDSLEAAHVIPVDEDGIEVVENGIVLRADLHRLYDKKRFYIAPSGAVVRISNEISEQYRALLRNKHIPESVLARVRDALVRRDA